MLLAQVLSIIVYLVVYIYIYILPVLMKSSNEALSSQKQNFDSKVDIASLSGIPGSLLYRLYYRNFASVTKYI